jgi:hypothetical protein
MTGKVLWHVTMLLDGFIAGPGDSMEWASEHLTGLSDAGRITDLRFHVKDRRR